MGRNAGGVNQYGGSGGYAKDVKRYINDTLKRKYDLKDKDTKLLRKFIIEGTIDYRDNELK